MWCHKRPQEETPRVVRRQKEMTRRNGPKAFTVRPARKARQGARHSLGLASLNDISRLWALGAASVILEPC